jgi:hypothetical protein
MGEGDELLKGTMNIKVELSKPASPRKELYNRIIKLCKIRSKTRLNFVN